MKQSTVRYLTYILAAWILSWGVALSFPAFAALHPSAGATVQAHHGKNLAINIPAHTRPGGLDDEFILIEQENPGTDAPALTDLEQPQTIAAAGPLTFPRAAILVQVYTPLSTLPAEPRFLRFRRLLI